MNHRDANPPRHLQDGASRPSSQSPREERTSAESTHNLHTRQPFERPSQSAMRLIEHDPGHSASAQGFARQQLSNVVEDPRYIPYPHISTQNLGLSPSLISHRLVSSLSSLSTFDGKLLGITSPVQHARLFNSSPVSSTHLYGRFKLAIFKQYRGHAARHNNSGITRCSLRDNPKVFEQHGTRVTATWEPIPFISSPSSA